MGSDLLSMALWFATLLFHPNKESEGFFYLIIQTEVSFDIYLSPFQQLALHSVSNNKTQKHSKLLNDQTQCD